MEDIQKKLRNFTPVSLFHFYRYWLYFKGGQHNHRGGTDQLPLVDSSDQEKPLHPSGLSPLCYDCSLVVFGGSDQDHQDIGMRSSMVMMNLMNTVNMMNMMNLMNINMMNMRSNIGSICWSFPWIYQYYPQFSVLASVWGLFLDRYNI